MVNNNFVTPARFYAARFGTPWVIKGQEYAQAQWQKTAQPKITKLQALTQEKYDQSLAPYLSQAGEVIEPYYGIARTNVLQMYYEHILPGYEFAEPYAAQGYRLTSDFATAKAVPAAYWAYDKSYAFAYTAIWPQVRVLYLENVEPQLVRIGERLGRYKTNAPIGETMIRFVPR